MASTVAAKAKKRGVRFGQYELKKRIARGGMAEIFLAIEHKIEGVKREVCVKRVLPQMLESDDFVTMFMDEARLATRLAHPNVAHVYNFGEVGGNYFIAMEYVDGLTVSRLIRLMGQEHIPLEMSLRIMADACSGLHYAHELKDENGRLLGVVHRDVSPQNIMVSRAGVAKLLDFGVAHASTQVHHTAVGQLKGKLAYMSPEQFRGDLVDRRADVFAAGVVLYEMLTGKPLFRRENEAATMHALLYDDPPSLAGFGAPPELDEIIARACHKDIHLRYQTTEEMQEALEDIAVRAGKLVTSKMLGKFVDYGRQLAKDAKSNVKKEKPIPDGTPSHLSLAKLAGPPPPPPPQSYDSGMGIPPPPPPLPGQSVGPPRLPNTTEHPTPAEIPSGRGSASSMETPLAASNMEPRREKRGLLIAVVALLALLLVVSSGLALWYGLSSTRTSDVVDLAANQLPSNDGIPGNGNVTTPDPNTPPVAGDSTKNANVGGSALGVSAAATQPDAGSGTAPEKAQQVDGGAVSNATLDANDTDSGPSETAERRRFGKLWLNTTPWSKVRVGGRSLGTTPIVGARVPEGRHTIRLTDAEGRTHTRRVQIKANQPTKLFVNLRGGG